MEPNREELAWAAGFFDGEGNIRCSNPRGKTPAISIAQIDPQVLHRFNKATLSLARIYGPYKPKTINSHPYWVYGLHSHARVQAIVAMLWEFLSPVKRAQAKKALGLSRRPSKKPGPKRLERCKRGHDMSITRYIRPNGLAGSCKTCAQMRGGYKSNAHHRV